MLGTLALLYFGYVQLATALLDPQHLRTESHVVRLSTISDYNAGVLVRVSVRADCVPSLRSAAVLRACCCA